MAGGLQSFGGKLAPPFKAKQSKKGPPSDARKRALIARLTRQEQRLEKGKTKTVAETQLEQRITILGGKPYTGKR